MTEKEKELACCLSKLDAELRLSARGAGPCGGATLPFPRKL